MAARKKTRTGRGARAQRRARRTEALPKPGPIPRRIFAQASPHSIGGTSMFDAGERICADTVPNFASEEDLIERSVLRLRDAGFEVLQVSETTINIAGSAKAFEQAFNTRIVAEEREVIKELGRETSATFLECSDTELPGLIATRGTPFEDILEGVALEEPRYFMAAPHPPTRSYWHLRVPADVSLACNADRAHRAGISGRGVRVAMVDSGHFRHPFFVGRGYRVAPVILGPGAANPLRDESGHGTGESANIFAVAPDVELLPVKISFVNSTGAFNAAVALSPDIITCSWGSSRPNGPLSAADQTLAAAIAAAVASRITVVFSAGNGHWGFPGQHPDVISAGGVFMDRDESLRASDYASGFMSNIYPNRRVPDLSGLVGMRPKAIYIMLPVEPQDAIDSTPWNDPSGGGLQGGNHPQGDETANNDGWGAFSGTSAAAPQLAGAAALIKQACPALTPAQVRSILMSTARDVTAGQCHPNTGANPAQVGPDTATGNGLVDAQRAALLAKIRCLGPIRPPIRPPVGPPIGPPVRPPVLPPVRPPIRPPIQPPVLPPVRPPIRPPVLPPVRPPIRPTPVQPIAPAAEEMTAQEAPGPALSAEDVEALEQMIMQSDVDLTELE